MLQIRQLVIKIQREREDLILTEQQITILTLQV